MRDTTFLLALVATVAQLAIGLELITDDFESVQNATSTVAYGLMKYYTGNVTNTPDTIAVLPAPYYWWEAGAMWGSMVDYWHYTNDSTYNNVTLQALVSQVGPAYDYIMPKQQFDEGNDDQAFWGFSVMSAAEKNFTAPPEGTPSWLELIENLWNNQISRWETATCGGGLRWQIYQSNAGFNYKNSVSNGALFQTSARLARYTGNQTYVDWAEKVWDWSAAIGLIDSSNYNVYDGAADSDTQNCTSLDHTTWTYNVAIYLYGAAVMYNFTDGSKIWEERVTGLLAATAPMFSPYSNATDIMFEFACEKSGNCDTDNYSFKAYLSRFMWATTKMAPYTTAQITSLLTTSAQAAARSCSGGTDTVTCGFKWYVGGWDGSYGVGQQMNALEVMQGLLINSTNPPNTGPDVHLHPSSVSSPVPIPSSNSTTAIPSSTIPISTTTIPSSTTSTQSTITATATVTSRACKRRRSLPAGALGGAAAAFGAHF